MATHPPTHPVGPFWVDPHSQAAQQAATNPGFAPITDQLTALSLTGAVGDTTTLAPAVAQSRSAHRTLIVSVYAIPHRDVASGYSAGGATSDAAYLADARGLAQQLTGSTPCSSSSRTRSDRSATCLPANSRTATRC